MWQKISEPIRRVFRKRLHEGPKIVTVVTL